MSSQIETSADAAAMPAATLDALAVSGEQPGWRVLDTARAQQFTGEIVFQTHPVVTVYFDSGRAYYAVSAGDPSLCDRLIEFGVVEPAQIERGVIRVGNVENLGRLFDRDHSVDRDAVMVVLELATDEVVTTIANTATSSFTSTAYRHHASGVHRWFVAPSDSARRTPTQLAPVGEVAQIDASVTSDLPGLAGLPDELDDGVHIEWDQPLGDDDYLQAPVPLHTLDDSMLQSMLDADIAPTSTTRAEAAESIAPTEPAAAAEPFAPPTVAAVDPAPDAAEVAPVINPTPSIIEPAPAAQDALGIDVVADDTFAHDDDTAEEGPSDHFQIVWPDGSEQELLGPETTTGDEPTAQADQRNDAATEAAQPAPVAAPPVEAPAEEASAEEAPAVDDDLIQLSVIVPADEIITPIPEPAPAPLTFELPTLAVTDNNVPEDHQPEEVVDAVRRALEAIESAAASPARLSSVAIGDLPSFEATTPLQFDAVDPLVVEPRPGDVEITTPTVEAPIAPTVVSAPVDVVNTTIEPFTEPADELAPEPSPVSALESAMSPRAATPAPVETPTQVAEPAAEPVVASGPASPAGFAAPTMNDSAVAVYARAAKEAAPAGPASGVASVVFLDEDPNEDEARTGALQRLIGSLRRK